MRSPTPSIKFFQYRICHGVNHDVISLEEPLTTHEACKTNPFVLLQVSIIHSVSRRWAAGLAQLASVLVQSNHWSARLSSTCFVSHVTSCRSAAGGAECAGAEPRSRSERPWTTWTASTAAATMSSSVRGVPEEDGEQYSTSIQAHQDELAVDLFRAVEAYEDKAYVSMYPGHRYPRQPKPLAPKGDRISPCVGPTFPASNPQKSPLLLDDI